MNWFRFVVFTITVHAAMAAASGDISRTVFAVTSTYQIEATAPGMTGFRELTIVSGTMIEVPVELHPELVRQSLTVSGTEDTPQDSTNQTVIPSSEPESKRSL